EQHIVEVGDQEVAIIVMGIHWHNGVHHTGNTTNGEHTHHTHSKHHCCGEPHLAERHSSEPVEYLHTGRDSDGHGGGTEHGIGCGSKAGGEHVVSPYTEAQEGNGGRSVHHDAVAKEWLTAEGRNDFRNDTEHRQDHDVHLGV